MKVARLVTTCAPICSSGKKAVVDGSVDDLVLDTLKVTASFSTRRFLYSLMAYQPQYITEKELQQIKCPVRSCRATFGRHPAGSIAKQGVFRSTYAQPKSLRNAGSTHFPGGCMKPRRYSTWY